MKNVINRDMPRLICALSALDAIGDKGWKRVTEQAAKEHGLTAGHKWNAVAAAGVLEQQLGLSIAPSLVRDILEGQGYTPHRMLKASEPASDYDNLRARQDFMEWLVGRFFRSSGRRVPPQWDVEDVDPALLEQYRNARDGIPVV